MRAPKSAVRVSFLLGALVASAAFAQTGVAVLTGTVTDAASNKPVPDVVVTATSPALQGEEIVVSDAAGTYRIPNLPPGTYTLRLEKESYRPYSRADVALRIDRTVRLNIQLQPEALKAEEVVVVGRPPTIDVGSTTTGMNVGQDFVNNVALIRPGAGGTGTRSFESLAQVAPGVNGDSYGFSVSGTTSPENQFVIDGLSVNNPAYGVLGTPLSIEFIQDVNVITGGYMPEYGRATGGIMNAVTKSGSNEFHGSVFGTWSPGSLDGPAKTVASDASSISHKVHSWNVGDFGVTIGGPILKDKLWFFAGFNPSFDRVAEDRTYNQFTDCNGDGKINSDDVDAKSGFRCASQITGGKRTFFADQRSYQYIAKLTYLINSDNNVTLSLYGAPTTAGGGHSLGISPATAGQGVAGGIDNLSAGDFNAIAQTYRSSAYDGSLKYASSFLDKRLLFDVTLGWHHEDNGTSPSDGTGMGSTTGLAATPEIIYRRTAPHSLSDFVSDPNVQAACATAGSCPVNTYATGGTGFMDASQLDRYEGRLVGTMLLTALGHHVIKLGLDIELMNYVHAKTYTGGVALRESTGGGSFTDFRQYGYYAGPDNFVLSNDVAGSPGSYKAEVKSTTVGGFVQDSWAIADLVTLNAGLRYDQQAIYSADGTIGMFLNNEWSPRLGLVYDFTQQGRSKVFANYARYYESVPLDLADRSFPGERQGGFTHARTAPTGMGCDPLSGSYTNCLTQSGKVPANATQRGFANDPTHYGFQTGGPETVDPNLTPQGSEEEVVGGEYELIPDGRVGATYTHRQMTNVIEDMSRDEANTYFIGNPGSGLAKDFPKATRNYDAVTVYFNKSFSDLWLAQVSYTWSQLYGNYAGLFRPETGQLDPNINSDFDLISLLPNRTGALPGDRTHVIKVFGAKEFVLTGSMSINLGATWRSASGTPISYLGSHALYGSGEVFILPRGAAGRTPWTHGLDGRLAFTYRFTKDNAVQLSCDVFNIFNFSEAVLVDENYTFADVSPVSVASGANPQQAICVAGNDKNCVSQLHAPGGSPGDGSVTASDINTNFKKPTLYQSPRSVRFGLRVTF